jgi:hypothetical protein
LPPLNVLQDHLTWCRAHRLKQESNVLENPGQQAALTCDRLPVFAEPADMPCQSYFGGRRCAVGVLSFVSLNGSLNDKDVSRFQWSHFSSFCNAWCFRAGPHYLQEVQRGMARVYGEPRSQASYSTNLRLIVWRITCSSTHVNSRLSLIATPYYFPLHVGGSTYIFSRSKQAGAASRSKR